MRRSLILFIGILVFLTGCQEKSKNENSKSTSTNTTSTVKLTTKQTDEEELLTDSQTSTTDKVDDNKTTSTTTTNSNKTTTEPSKKTDKTTTSQEMNTNKTTSSTTKKTTTTTTTTTTKKSTTTTTTKKQLTEKDVYNAMIAFKKKYPDGTPWDNSNYYAWKGGYYSGGYGCAGFAFMLSDAAFGSAKATKHTDISKIRVGDILRMNEDTHSVIVLTVDSSGVTVAEGNYNSSVHWGRKISTSELKSSVDYIFTRW